MQVGEELQILASRHLDGETTPAEDAALRAALADPAFAEWFEDLKRAHEVVAEFAAQNPAPADIAVGVQRAIAGKVHAMPRAAWSAWVAVAASVILALGLVIAANMMGGSGPPQDPPIAAAPPKQADITILSTGNVRLEDAAGTNETGNGSRRVALPASVFAPAGTHAVLRVGAATAVLKPGSVARLADVDADGVPQIESVEGDLYLESRRGALASRLGEHHVRLERSGMLLRHHLGDMLAEPKFGSVRIGRHDVRSHEIMRAAGAHLEGATQAKGSLLEEWVIDGRLDAVRQELRVLLGDVYDKLPPEFHTYWEKPLRGIMSRPAEAATSAMLIRFFEQHLWLPEWGEGERSSLRNLADIVGEGTTEDDVPQRIRDEIAPYRELALKYPDAARRLIRGMLEQRRAAKPEGSTPDPRDPG